MSKFHLSEFFSRFFGVPMRYWVATAVVAVSCMGAVAQKTPPGPPIHDIQTGALRGTIYVQFGSQEVDVTDFPVFLKNTATNANSKPVTTNRFGRYYFPTQTNGNYHICWSAPGWAPGCGAQLISIRSNLSYVDALRVTPQKKSAAGSSGATIWGRVALADGSSPWFFDWYFGVKQDVEVVARAGSTAVATVNTNAQGQFVIPYVPSFANRTYQLTAKAGGGMDVVAVKSGGDKPVTITIKDRRPVIAAIVTRLAGQARSEVPVAGKLEVTGYVIDADGDAINMTWKLAPANGSLSAKNGRATTWTLPGQAGIKRIYVLANDGRGGIAIRSAGISAGADKTYFGVRLYDTSTQKIVTTAKVTVNNTAATVADKDLFVAKAAIANRYVVNVSAPGYIFMSRIYGHGGVFHKMPLVRAALSRMNAESTTTIADTRDPKTLQRYHYSKGARASITIRGGALVSSDNKPASGKLSTEIAALDLSSEQFPGDNRAMINGKDERLVPYGAVSMEIRDASGARLQLAAGQTADVTIPVPATVPNPPAKASLSSYNETTGFWEKLPNDATYSPSLHAYKGTVPHLSTYAVAYSGADTACIRILLDNVMPGRLKARVTPVAGGTWFPTTPLFDIRDPLNAIFQLPPNQLVDLQITDNTGHFVPVLFFEEAQNRPLRQSNYYPWVGDAQVRTGSPSTEHSPGLPYASCKLISLRFSEDNQANANALHFLNLADAIDAPTDENDYYKHLDPGLTTDPNDHDHYIYEDGERGTLGGFWHLGGFGGDGRHPTGTYAHASYLNYNDLGYGRDVWINKVDATHVYAYVVNYTNFDHADMGELYGDWYENGYNYNRAPDQNPLDAIYARDNDRAHVASVLAMEATDLPNPPGPAMPKVVKFWNYFSNSAESPLMGTVDLDGFGQKRVPQVCQGCHGGKPLANSPTHSVLDYALRTQSDGPGAVFREFDLATFVYPNVGAPHSGSLHGPTTVPEGLGNFGDVAPAEQQQFYHLNQLVIASGADLSIGGASGANLAIQQVIEGIDPCSLILNPGCSFNPQWVPPGSGWDDHAAKQSLYTNVVAKSCRGCHLAVGPNFQTWFIFSRNRAAIARTVCGVNGSVSMPNSLMTYRDFWQGSMGAPYEPSALAAFSAPRDVVNPAWAPLGTCNPPPYDPSGYVSGLHH